MYLTETISIYSISVVRKLWIGTIHGLRRPKYGSVLCATIHGLSVQSMDRANEGIEAVADPGVGQVGPGPPKLAQLKF